MRMPTLRDLELLAVVYHVCGRDGEAAFNPTKASVSFCGPLNSWQKVVALLEKWSPCGLVKRADGDSLKVLDQVLEVLLAVSAKASNGNPAWLHRLCVGYSRMSPGNSDLVNKPPISVRPNPEDFGFKAKEQALADEFVGRMLREAKLLPVQGDATRARFKINPFCQLPSMQDTLIDEALLVGVLIKLKVSFTGVVEPSSLPPDNPPPPSPPPPPVLAVDTGKKGVKKPRITTVFKEKTQKLCNFLARGQMSFGTSAEIKAAVGTSDASTFYAFIKTLEKVGWAKVEKVGKHTIKAVHLLDACPYLKTASEAVPDTVCPPQPQDDARAVSAHVVEEKRGVEQPHAAPPAVVVSAQLKQLGGLGKGLLALQSLLDTDAGHEMDAEVVSASNTFVNLIKTIAGNAEVLLAERRKGPGK